MKTITLACLLLALSACKKFDGVDMTGPQGKKPVWVTPEDTIPDHATFALKLIRDSTNYDETLFVFDHKANMEFTNAYDAPYFPGFGKVGLSSISSDGRDMAIYDLPYKRGMSVGLDLYSQEDGTLSLKISRQKNIPQGIRLWVKDTYANDSLDLCKGAYSFQVIKADKNTFGSNRLRLVLTSVQGY